MKAIVLFLVVMLSAGSAQSKEGSQSLSFAGFDFSIESGYEHVVVGPGVSKSAGFLYQKNPVGQRDRVFFTDLTFSDVYENVDYGCAVMELYSSVFNKDRKQNCNAEHVYALQDVFVNERSVTKERMAEATVYYVSDVSVLGQAVAHAIIIAKDGRVILVESTKGVDDLKRILQVAH